MRSSPEQIDRACESIISNMSLLVNVDNALNEVRIGLPDMTLQHQQTKINLVDICNELRYGIWSPTEARVHVSRLTEELGDTPAKFMVTKALYDGLTNRRKELEDSNEKLSNVISRKRIEITLHADNIVYSTGNRLSSPIPEPMRNGDIFIIKANCTDSTRSARIAPYMNFIGYDLSGWTKQGTHMISLVNSDALQQVTLRAVR